MRCAALLATLLLAPLSATAQFQVIAPKTKHPSAFAILVDKATHDAAKAEVEGYRAAVEKDALAAYTLVGAWPTPESVRDAIRGYFKPAVNKTPPLEGVVLVGAIPVPMLRDAQHLTSAFKMDQTRYPWRRSSVPSDRFYDDYDLKFDFLKRDEKEPLLFYYSLRPDSAQRVRKEIYSARVFTADRTGKGIASIKRWLVKAAALKAAGPQPITRMLLVAGHGYNSESVTAWRWEHLTLREQFPQLFLPGGWLRSYWHESTYGLKAILFRELQRAPVQLALFHAHGSPDTQYILGNPPAPSARAQIEEAKRFFRGRLRRAKKRGKSVAEEQVKIMRSYGVPLSWLENAFDPKVTAADDALVAKQDIHAADLEKIAPRARFVIFDQCFNGRFIDKVCMANAYVLGTGETVVAMANTVNVLQDIWSDEGLERLNQGKRVGAFHKHRHYLESHLIGDPTWRWKPHAYPLAGPAKGKLTLEGDLVLPDPSDPVNGMDSIRRIAAFQEACCDRDKSLTAKLPAHLKDPLEFIRRKAAFIMGDVGADSYAAPLLEAMIFDPSRRVSFVAKGALQKLHPRAVAKAWKALQEREAAHLPQDPALRKRLERMVAPPSWRAADLKRLQDPKAPIKKRVGSARSFRNHRAHHTVPVLLKVAADPAVPVQVRKVVVEALGWFQYSHRRGEIIAALEKVGVQPNLPAGVAKETAKTIRRLTTGPNVPLIP